MLTLSSLTVVDFGPFKGEQRIGFPQEHGVTIVYGENMRGKTYLLNAIRYALFGKIVGRGSQPIPLDRVANWESVADGRTSFKVVLAFAYDGHRYELTRECSLRHGSGEDGSQSYVQDVYLRRDGNVLSPGERETELAKIMPEKVSRFFLFDGELLQEYEELLRDESDMGPKITEAIERILGVPILTNARADLGDIRKTAQRQESKAAQKDLKTRELGNHLEAATEERAHHERELQRLKGDLERLGATRASIETALRQTEKIRSLLDQRDELEKDMMLLEQRLAEKRERLKQSMRDAWRGMLRERAKHLTEELRAAAAALQEKIVAHSVNENLAHLRERAVSEGRCPTCLRALDAGTAKGLEGEHPGQQSPTDVTAESQKLKETLHVLGRLEQFEIPDTERVVREIVDTIGDIGVEIRMKQDKLEEIKDRTRDFDQTEIRAQQAERDRVLDQMSAVRDGIKGEEKRLGEIEVAIRGLYRQLDRLGGVNLQLERRRRVLCEKLQDLFSEGVGIYRDRLRERVERDSTRLFLRLTTEPDYGGLRINESYGLTIMHKDGTPIPVRSAGAEHIVALSLMGALQNNAPLRGPIIMDSPFGRLDELHTTRVVRALPDMASQVMLLVYEAELKPQLARNELLGKLRGEYKMVRKSARYTSLEKSLGVA